MDRMVSGLVFGSLFLSVLALIGLWYLALFGIAVIVFVVLFVVSRTQHKASREALMFRPGTLVPAEAWKRTQGSHYTQGPRAAVVSLVSLEEYGDNWEKFREIAQIERETDLAVTAKLVCFKTATADRGILVAYRQMILGHVRDIEAERFFDQLWQLGGVFKVDCVVTFDSSLHVSEVNCAIKYVDAQRDRDYPSREKQAWDTIWGGVRGKRLEEDWS